jgi:acetyl esterase/lipase
MVFPLSVALSAGIAALSVAIFGTGLIAIAVLYKKRPAKEYPLITLALIAALFGFVFPQIAFMLTAQRENVTLSFDPLSYVTVSGATTVQPSELIAYKTIAQGKLELAYYRSAEPGTRPAVLLLHGGGWRYGSHLETGDWPRVLTEAGYNVFSVQYRLSSDTYHTWRDAPHDIHDAYLYIQSQAERLAVDPSRIHLLGQSAGGHLALLEAYLHNDAESVVSLYAPIDLELDYTTSRDKSAELDFIGGPPKQYLGRYRAVSPITYVSPHAPSTLIIQGKTDDLVATKNATRLAASLVENRIEHDVVLLPMTGHSFENQRGGFATQIAQQRVLRFLSR